MAFRCVNGKMGNMRKAVEWVLYPIDASNPGAIVIQSDNRIARVNLHNGRAMLSDGKGGHQGRIKLSPSFGAVEVAVPADMLNAIRGHVAGFSVGDGIGTIRLVG